MTAKEAAVDLGVLRYYPSDPQALLKISKIISHWLKTPEQIDEMVNEMTTLGRYNEWPGPGVLVAECKAIAAKNQEAEYSFPWDEPEVCERCQSMGYFPDSDGTYLRCECNNGLVLDDVLLAELNRRSPKQSKKRGLSPIEMADFDATVAAAVKASRARNIRRDQ